MIFSFILTDIYECFLGEVEEEKYGVEEEVEEKYGIEVDVDVEYGVEVEERMEVHRGRKREKMRAN